MPLLAYGPSNTLPIMYVNVYTDSSHSAFNNEINSYSLDHKDYFEFAEYWLDTTPCSWLDGNVGSKEAPLAMQIKARGNWSRTGFSKKPFKIKMNDKKSLLGMSKSKHYTLLAHADDTYGYLRNFVNFNLGKRIGLPWTPSMQPIELVVNGDYRGIYFLTEAIRVEKDRINIQELPDDCSDPDLCSGGYLVELDNYDGDNQIRMEEKTFVGGYTDMLRITFDTPEVYSELQKKFVTDQFTAMNNAVGSNSNDLWKYLDMDDLARYYLVEEICSHTESFHGSTYLYRDRGDNQKWHFSPLWDAGQAFNGPTNDFFYYHTPYGATWIASIRQNYAFNNCVKDTWKWFMSNRFYGIYDDIETYVNRISAAAKADRERWRDVEKPYYGMWVADNSNMQDRKNAVLNHLRDKLSFLRGAFGSYDGQHPEPQRDSTPAATLPSYVSGVENVSIQGCDIPEYYDLNGTRVQNPSSGIYIERRGATARKVLVR